LVFSGVHFPPNLVVPWPRDSVPHRPPFCVLGQLYLRIPVPFSLNIFYSSNFSPPPPRPSAPTPRWCAVLSPGGSGQPDRAFVLAPVGHPMSLACEPPPGLLGFPPFSKKKPVRPVPCRRARPKIAGGEKCLAAPNCEPRLAPHRLVGMRDESWGFKGTSRVPPGH